MAESRRFPERNMLPMIDRRAHAGRGFLLQGSNYRPTLLRMRTLFLGILLTAIAFAEGEPVKVRAALDAANDFCYWLQDIDAKALAASEFDLAVIDACRDGGEEGRFTAAEVTAMKREPDGGRRVMLAYLSIGEAENYRGYWKKEWGDAPPAWLGPENPDWPGNFEVRYWDPAWQAIIFGGKAAQLDRILEAGFDGCYLDVVDGYEFWEARGERGPGNVKPRAAMVAFVRAISAYAKRKNPDFLVFVQNAEDLGADKGYLDAVDGIGREEVWFAEGEANEKEDVSAAEDALGRFARAGKKVLCIEYVTEEATKKELFRKCRKKGWLLHCPGKELDKLHVDAGHEPD